MIDIHSHILPGLDDGAQTIEQSLEMANAAAADGITTVVATPHVNWPQPLDRQTIESQLALLRQLCAGQGPNLSILPGAELHLEMGLADGLVAGSLLPINEGPYALIELPTWNYPKYIEHVIFQLQVSGFSPVLAHPERVSAFQRDINILHKLVTRGVLTQVTAASLLGDFGSTVKNVAERMLTHNLAHVIASDSHSLTQRPPVLRAAMERAGQLIGEERAWAMVTTTPQAIVEGTPLTMPEPIEYKPRKKWGII